MKKALVLSVFLFSHFASAAPLDARCEKLIERFGALFSQQVSDVMVEADGLMNLGGSYTAKGKQLMRDADTARNALENMANFVPLAEREEHVLQAICAIYPQDSAVYHAISSMPQE